MSNSNGYKKADDYSSFYEYRDQEALNLLIKTERHFPDFRLTGMILSMPVNWLMGSKYSHIFIYCTYIILVISILVNL